MSSCFLLVSLAVSRPETEAPLHPAAAQYNPQSGSGSGQFSAGDGNTSVADKQADTPHDAAVTVLSCYNTWTLRWKVFKMSSQGVVLKSLPGFGFLPEYVIKECQHYHKINFVLSGLLLKDKSIRKHRHNSITSLMPFPITTI